MNHTPYRIIYSGLLSVLIIFCCFPVLAPKSLAANLTVDQLHSALNDSLKTMWVGEKFSPELKKKQKILKKMLKNGTITTVALKNMMKKEMLSILNQHKTSRYNLQEIDKRSNKLFSPVLDWETIKEEIIWDVIVSNLDKEPYVLKLATLAPEGTPWLEIPQTILVPKILKLTNGAIKPKFYTGGVMGDDADVLRKMDIEQLDGCGCTTLGVFKASPDASILMVPNLFNNYQETDYILKTFRKKLDESFEERGYICGAIIDTGFLYVFSRKEIFDFNHLRQQKTVTTLGNIESTLLDELGVDAVPMAIPEVVSALSTGLADTFIAPAAWALGMQAYQYFNYYINTPFFYSPGVVLLSSSTRDKIQKHFDLTDALVWNIQELIVLELKLIEPVWKKQGRIYEKRSLQAFESKCGIQPVTLSPEDRKTFEAAARRTQEKLAGKDYSLELLNDVLSELEIFRKK